MSSEQTSPPTSYRRRELYADTLFRRLFATRVLRFELIGAAQMGEHALARLEEATPDPIDRARFHDWVASCLTYPLRSLLIDANRSARGFLLVNLVVVGGGFAASGVAVAAEPSRDSAASWAIFAVGLAVALAGGIAHMFRFGFRSSERKALAVALRQEGWHFANAFGEYAGDTMQAFQLLQERVAAIEVKIAQVASVEAEAQATQGPSSASTSAASASAG